MMICTISRIEPGICRRITLTAPAESTSTTVSAAAMVSAMSSEVVTASAEQMPRICSVTGFCRISGVVSVLHRSIRRGMRQNSPRRIASMTLP